MGHDPLDPYEEEVRRAAFEGRRFRANLRARLVSLGIIPGNGMIPNQSKIVFV